MKTSSSKFRRRFDMRKPVGRRFDPSEERLESGWTTDAYSERRTPRLERSSASRLTRRPGGNQWVSVRAATNAALAAGEAAAQAVQMISTFRSRGHQLAQTNPLQSTALPGPQLSDLGFNGASAKRRLPIEEILGLRRPTAEQLFDRLRELYCGSVGCELSHLDDPNEVEWLQTRIESGRLQEPLSEAQRGKLLEDVGRATELEAAMDAAFPRAKRFSLEGSEVLIPLLNHVLEQTPQDVVLGMAHRGRLNVMTNVVGAPPESIFSAFAHPPEQPSGTDDLPFHLGAEQTRNGSRVSLCANPSHLEYVNPVALGRLRARQTNAGDAEHRQGLSVLIHGDAAFSGEGIVSESLNLAQLDAYGVGGTLHIVLNNQVGFTTEHDQGRSTRNATDIAKGLDIPVLHVNGDDPDAVIRAVDLASEYRETFHKDVVIDLICVRQKAHVEFDDASMTQPRMTQSISKRRPLFDNYRHAVSEDAARAVADRVSAYRSGLDALIQAAKKHPEQTKSAPATNAQPAPAVEALSAEHLDSLIGSISQVPDGFVAHKKIISVLKRRAAAARIGVDWGTAEALAFASLATAGTAVRMTGQDCERGAFGHRHATWVDQESGARFRPLENLSADQAPVEIRNSPLSEAAVLGFEYGYSLETKRALVLWEAQFGDFANAAQVYIDQFISAGEAKWGQKSGLTLLLPHGLEGSGPEHSSARLERFLGLCAENNLRVVQPSSPAQYFHLLREQAAAERPLVVLTPKRGLHATKSPASELSAGHFRPLIAPPPSADDANKTKVLLTSGELAASLESRIENAQRSDVAVVRIEQLYPLDASAVRDLLARFPKAEVVWVQQEPENMGAYQHVRATLGGELACVSRPASARPATGSATAHAVQEDELLEAALGE